MGNGILGGNVKLYSILLTVSFLISVLCVLLLGRQPATTTTVAYESVGIPQDYSETRLS